MYKSEKSRRRELAARYTAGTLVKLSDAAHIEGDKDLFGHGLVLTGPQPDGYGGWRVRVELSQLGKPNSPMVSDFYVEYLDIVGEDTEVREVAQ